MIQNNPDLVNPSVHCVCLAGLLSIPITTREGDKGLAGRLNLSECVIVHLGLCCVVTCYCCDLGLEKERKKSSTEQYKVTQKAKEREEDGHMLITIHWAEEEKILRVCRREHTMERR